MSKYLELAELACDQSARTFDLREKCKRFANQIIFGYQKYLEIPDTHFSTITVGENLEASKEKGSDFRIHLTHRSDGLWWFGFYIHYEMKDRRTYLEQFVKLGLEPQGNKFRVRMNGDKIIDPNSEDEINEFFDELYKADKNEFMEDSSSSKNKIGFIR